MLSAQGKNLYLDFSINPDKPCYTAEEDEQNPTSNVFLRANIPTAGKHRSNQHSPSSSIASSVNHSMNGSDRGSYRQKSPSPSSALEKPHATNPLLHLTEKGNYQRPNSMMMLPSRESKDREESRYVKEPSLLKPAWNNGVPGGERRGGSDGAINLYSGPSSSSSSHQRPPTLLPPEIIITET